jgi:hypothetical protein
LACNVPRAEYFVCQSNKVGEEVAMPLSRRSGLVLSMLLLATGCDDDTTDGAPPDLSTMSSADLALPAPTVDLSAPAANDLSAAAPNDLAAPQGPDPFVVDDTFAASGYEGGGGGTITDDQNCPARAGGGRGHCHDIQWTPGTNSWGGVVWQYPANNWGGATGFAIPAGYGQVRFWAWGKTGGEQVAFLVGLGGGGPDQFQQRVDVTLSATPRLYVLGVRAAYGDHVVSAFGWVTGAAAAQTFYVDDITWTGDDEGNADAPPSFDVDTKFSPSGYMGDGSMGFVRQSGCASPSGDATCHHFAWDPSSDAGGVSQGWAGVFWQSAPGNWGGATDPAGADVAAGYREVRFWAWSTGAGGESVSFLVGLGGATHDGWQSKLDVTLKTTPTLYTVGVGGDFGAHVVGGLGWVAGGGAGLAFNLDGAAWR